MKQKDITNLKKKRPNTIGILIDENITKNDCFKILKNEGLKLPEIYRLGYPNANCIGCVKASSPTYWNHVRNFNVVGALTNDSKNSM